MADYKSQVRGCLFGGAIGDAFGYTVEFKSLSSIRASYGEGGIQEPEETDGQFVISDDTQMTMFTLERLSVPLLKTRKIERLQLIL